MARPLRVDAEGGWYHVRARGIERRAIFEDRLDHEHFLQLLAGLPDRYGVEVHAYALMGNHHHPLIATGGSMLCATSFAMARANC